MVAKKRRLQCLDTSKQILGAALLQFAHRPNLHREKLQWRRPLEFRAILCGHVFSLGKSMEMRCSTLFKPLNLGIPTSSQAHLTICFMLGNLVVGLPVLFQVNLVLMQTGHIRDIMLYCSVNGCAINYEHPQ